MLINTLLNYQILIYIFIQNPFLGSDFHDTANNILHKPLRFGSLFQKHTIDLLSKLLDRSPDSRIKTAAEIKRHPWFKGLDWQKLALKKLQPPFNISVVCE